VSEDFDEPPPTPREREYYLRLERGIWIAIALAACGMAVTMFFVWLAK